MPPEPQNAPWHENIAYDAAEVVESASITDRLEGSSTVLIRKNEETVRLPLVMNERDDAVLLAELSSLLGESVLEENEAALYVADETRRKNAPKRLFKAARS